MRLLVLGGTRFVGAAVVEDALARGWDVTVLHRGLTGRPPDGVTVLLGDRTEPARLAALENGTWDAVVDTWSSAPSVVRDAARVLASRVDQYAYVSSRSVYAWPPPMGADESAPLVPADPDAGATDYAADKRGAEIALDREIGASRVLHARAGLILGPREDIDRLPWYLRRAANGGPMLAPGPAELPLQYIDARDLAAFLLDGLVRGTVGPMNVVSPMGHTTMGQLLGEVVKATGGRAELVWIDPQFLLDHDVEPWSDLPIWVPPDSEIFAMHSGDVSRALAAGLRCRPVAETVADTWAWMQSSPRPPVRKDRPPVGIDTEREQALLAGWSALQKP
jgi:nucleoside-diphosphate-sugar epimerase